MDYAALAERMSQAHCAHLRELYCLSEHLVCHGEDGMLLCLWGQEGPLLSGELMEKMGLTTGRVANLLRQMENKGLVRRWQDREDRRRVYVGLTDEGCARAEARYAEMTESHRKVLEALGEEKALEVLRVIEEYLSLMPGDR